MPSEVIMPKMGDAMTEGTLLAWTMPDGAKVKTGDVIAHIETDKSNVEIEAEDSGVLRLLVQPGAVVPVGEVIATIGDLSPSPSPKKGGELSAAKPETPVSAGAASSPAPHAEHPKYWGEDAEHSAVPHPARTAASGNGQARVKASPLARRVARESGIDIAAIIGTGPMGRIVEADVKAFLTQAKTVVAARPAPAAPSTPPPADVTPIELSAIRKVIAKRMVESKTTIPHFYLTAEIDMTEAVALREKLNAYDETLPKISFNDMVVKATAKALDKVPAVNARYADDRIYPGPGVHVGIAVALDDGLIVPVVRDANLLSLRKIASTGRELIKKARDKKLQPNEYSGGTFTVSNLGAFDIEEFTAIIDPAQGGILAVASILAKPVVLEDGVTIAVRQRMKVTYSGDHRVVDGAVGAKFVQEMRRILQNPLSLLE